MQTPNQITFLLCMDGSSLQTLDTLGSHLRSKIGMVLSLSDLSLALLPLMVSQEVELILEFTDNVVGAPELSRMNANGTLSGVTQSIDTW